MNTPRSLVAASAISALLLLPAAAKAEQAPDRDACVAAYEQAQVTLKRGRLGEARARLIVCLDDACPATLRSDCAQWLKDVDVRQSSVVIECTGPDGKPVAELRVLLDGKLLTERLDGRGIDVDPGEHTLRLELEGEPPLVTTIVVREGAKLQRVRTAFALRTRRAEAPTVGRAPVPWTVLALGGLGIAAAGGFVGFGAWGKSDKQELEACRPDCASAAVSDVRTKFVVADVMLGVSLVSLGAAAVLWLTRGPSPRPSIAQGFRLSQF